MFLSWPIRVRVVVVNAATTCHQYHNHKRICRVGDTESVHTQRGGEGGGVSTTTRLMCVGVYVDGGMTPSHCDVNRQSPTHSHSSHSHTNSNTVCSRTR